MGLEAVKILTTFLA